MTMEVKFDIESPLTACLSDLFLLESDYMLSPFYAQRLQSLDFDFSLRRDTVSLILQFCGCFDLFLSYLAVNYLDRFFSTQGMPLQKKPWVVKLLAITCVSLAAKMMKTEFSLSNFQCEEGLIFDSQAIKRMEMLILGALKWRMRSITPFAFLQIFTTFFKLKDPPLREALKARAVEIIFKAQNEMKLFEFKPSVVGASALVCASHELFPIQFPSFLKSISSCSYVDNEKLAGCINVMEGTLMDGYDSTTTLELGGVKTIGVGAISVSSSTTTVNVLDHRWSSSGSGSGSASCRSSDLSTGISQATTKRKAGAGAYGEGEQEQDKHECDCD